jgi:four helix bundle protein
MGDFTKLAVWKKAHELTVNVYRATANWPRHEMFALTSQTRRAAYSVPANVAEGCGRNTDAELARFARNSLGSASEPSYCFILARDLEYIVPREDAAFQASTAEVRRMLSSLERVSSLAARSERSRR